MDGVNEKREPKERAIAAKAVAIGLLRDLYKLSGKDASADATMLEMLSRRRLRCNLCEVFTRRGER